MVDSHMTSQRSAPRTITEPWWVRGMYRLFQVFYYLLLFCGRCVFALWLWWKPISAKPHSGEKA